MPNILEVVRKLQSTPPQFPVWSGARNALLENENIVHYTLEKRNLVFQDSLNLKGLLEALIRFSLNESHVPDIFTIANERARLRIRVLKKVYDVLQERIKEEG
jgi:hypothetical protein